MRAFVAAVAVVGTIAAAASAEPPDLDAPPILQPGTLAGRIVYTTDPRGCARFVFDLATGGSRPYPPDVCGSGRVVAYSRDARLVAVRNERDQQLEVVHPDGRRVRIGTPSGSRVPADFAYLPAFSPDSRRIATCIAASGAVVTVVADVSTGRVLERIRGACLVAYTARGVAVLRNGRVVLGGRVLLAPRKRAGDTQLGLPLDLATNPAGTQLAVTTRDYAPGKRSDRLTLRVLDLRGRIVSRFEASTAIPVAPIVLGPHGRSAVVWWGCIMQLARLDPARHRISFLFGEDGPVVSPLSWSPNGRFAAMGRSIYRPPPPPDPLPYPVVFDGDSLQPLYRIPVEGTNVLAWLP